MPRKVHITTLLILFLACGSRAAAQQQKIDAEGHEWWQHAVFYEVYPRSFADSNNDGIGDLKGITSKLDYLKDLGIDAIWITPCFPSPQVDFGYDVSDYENIDPMYGTLADFDRLVAEGKKRDNRLASLPNSFAKLQKLRHLDLRGNRFATFPAVVRAMPKLHKLDLRWNELRRLPAWLEELRARGCRVLV